MDFGRGKTTRRFILFGTFLGVFFGLFVSNFSTVFAAAGINQQINFQGRLLNSVGATVPDGFYNIQFKIYQDGDGQSVGDTTGSPAGTLKWTENYLNNASQGVKVQNGFLSVQLGSINAFGASIDWNQSSLWLSMNIGSTNSSCTPFTSCTPDGEMVPMQAMTTAVYALNALQLGGLTAASFGQLAANQTWTGVNTYRPGSDATNVFQLQKSTTGVGYITADSTNTQLVLGTASSLTGKLAFATVGGGTLTINPTSSASNFTITLPAETGTVCTTAAAGACSVAGAGYVQLAPLAVQADGTNNNTIFVNKTSGTGNIVELQKSGTDVFTIGNTGNIVATGTFNSNAFNSTTLTFGGASPTISPSTTNTGLTAQANGTGTLTLNTGGAGTVNVGTTNTTTVGIGSAAATIALLGTANINTSGSTNTSINTGTNSGTVAIGNSASTTNLLGATNINTSGTTNTSIGASGNTTAILGTTNINTSGSATTTVGNATGAIALQGTTTVSGAGNALIVTNDTTSGRLSVNGGTGFGTVEKFRVNTPLVTDNAAASIISTGNSANKALVLQSAASQSANLFEVQDSTGAVTLSINSAGSVVSNSRVQATEFRLTSTAPITKNYLVGTGGVSTNDVVVLVNDGGNARVLDTTTARDPNILGVANAGIGSGSFTTIVIAGSTTVNVDTGAVAIGDHLVTSSTSGKATVDNNATTGILGIATTAKAGGSAGTVGVNVQPYGGSVNPNFQAGNLTTTGTITSGLINGQTISATANLTGTLAVSGIITASSLGASSNDSVVCRNGTNQLAACTSTFIGSTAYTLQGAYNNSSNPELTLNSTNGGLTIRNDATNSIAANLFEIQDNAGTTTFFGVTKTGISTTLGVTQTGTGANTFSGATTFGAAGTALTVTNDATAGRFGANTSTFGTVQKFGVNTATTADNAATALISTGATGNKGLVIQGVSGQTGNLLQIQNSVGTLESGFTSSGSEYIVGGTVYNNAALSVSTGSFANPGIVVRGVASQSGDYLQAQDSTGAVQARITASGRLGLGGASASTSQLSIVTDNAATIGNIIKGSTSQSGDYFQLLDSSNVVLTEFNSSGYLGIGTTTAPNKFNINSATTADANATALIATGTATKGLVIQGSATQGTTNDLIEVQDSTGTVVFGTNSQGMTGVGRTVQTGTQLYVTTASSSTTGVVIQGRTGQSANYLQVTDVNSAKLLTVDNNGALTTYGTTTNHLGLGTPVITSASTIGTNFFYAVTATNAAGETIASNVLSMNANNSIINWTQITGATGYKVYRNTSNSFTSGTLLLATITNGSTVTYTDTGTATAGTFPPSAPTGTGLIVQGWASQSGNVLDIKAGNGVSAVTVNSNGRFQQLVNSANSFGGTAVAGQILTVNTASAGNVGLAVRGATSQSSDLFELQDTSGNVNAAFNSLGNQLTLGRVAASGTVTQGKLLFSDGTTDNFSSTLQSATLTSSQILTLPNETGTICSTGSICAGYASAAGYVQLQATTPGSAQTGNLNISGVGILGAGLTVSAGGAAITGTTTVNTSGSSNTSINTGTNNGTVAIGNSASTTNLLGATNINTSGTTNTSIGASGNTTAILGTTNINTSGTANTSINTGTNTGNVAIGNATGTFALASSTLNVSAGAVSGVTTLATSSTINLQTISATANFTGTLAVAGIITATSLGTASNDSVVCRNGTNQLAACNSTFLTSTNYTLQGAYTNSTNPEIVLNSTNGGLTIRNDATNSLAGNLLEVQDNAGTTTFFGVTKTGIATTLGISQTGSGANTFSGASSFTLASGTGLAVTANATVGGTINTDTLTATALTFSGVAPLISPSTTNTGLTAQANGTGTLTLNTGGAGTVNVGTTNSTSVGIGNSSSTNTVLGTTNINTSGTTNTSIGASGNTTAILGTTNINTSGSATTSINTGTSTGNTAIGNATGTFSLASSTLNVNAGAVSGVTTLSTSSTINSQTISSAANFTGTLAVAGIITATSLGTTSNDSVVCRNGSNQLAGCTSTFIGSTNYTLQGAYTNSTNPEIVLNSTNGGLTIRNDATNSLAGNLLEVQDNAGTTTFFGVTKTGINTTLGVTQTGSGANTFSGASSFTLASGTGLAVTSNATVGGTINTDTLTASALTFSGAAPVVSPSTTNTGLTTQANGTGTLTLNTGGAGTVNVGTTNSTVVGIGNSGSTNTIVGITNINTTGTTNTSINTGSNSGNVAIGNVTGTFALASSTLNVSAGAVTGVTTLATSGTINSQTISATANFTGTLAVAGIITATSLGASSNDSVVCRNGTNQLAACTSTFVGTTAYTLQGAYTNSTNPEITLNSTNGGLTIRNDATNSLAGNLLEVQDNAGTTTFFGVSKTAINSSLGYTQTGSGTNTFSGVSNFTLASGTGLAVTANATVGGTINTDTLTATALTFSGAAPVVSPSTTNTGLTVQSNGTGTLTLNSAGAGIVNVGTANTTTLGIGNSSATTTLSGILNLNNGGTAATTIGQGSSTAGTILIQGGVSSSFSATNATGTTKLAFAAPSTAGTVVFQLPAGGTGATTYDICTTMSVCAGYGSSTGANQSLSNLSTVAINTSLLPGVTNSINVGSASFTFQNGFFSNTVTAPTLTSGDVTAATTPSPAFTLRSGNATGSGSASATGAVSLKSGDSTNGASGAVNIDSGTASGGANGAITIGNTNSVNVTLGNTGANTVALIQGGSGATAIQLNQGLGGTITIGTAGSGSNVQVLCGVIAGAGCGFAANATDHSTTIGSATGTSLTTIKGGSGGLTLTGNITAAGTYNGNTFSSTALTFSGVAPIISASTTNTALTVQSNGTGTLTLNSTGAGTVNLGTANSTVLGIGNSSSVNTILGASTLTGVVKINDTGAAATTIGQGTGTAGIINIQGGAGSTFSVTNTSGKTILAIAAPSTSGTVTFQLPAGGVGTNTYDICTTLVVCAGYASSASANTALSNLAAVAINTSLLPGVTNSIDVGSAAKTFLNGYFSGIVTAPTVTSGDTTTASSPSAAFALRSGNTTGSSSGTGAVTLGSGNATTGSSGAVTIDSGTAGGGGTKGAVSIGAANTTNLTVGNTGSTTTTTINGGTTLSLQTASSGSISLGTTNASSISIGSSSNAGNSLSFGNSTTGETVNIENGATTAATTVAILSGVGTAGTATLSLGNNTRVTSISLGNINPAAARTIAIGNTTGTANTVVDTINIATNPTTAVGGNTVHIADGTPTGSGTNLVTIGSLVGGSSTVIQGGATGTGIQIVQGTGGNITIGSANTNSTVTVQCGAGILTTCGFGTNGNDHSTYVGSTTVVSNTVIQSGTGGINLNGAVTTNGTLVTGGTINTNTFSSAALTFSGASPVISASTTNTGMTLQANGVGILALSSGTGGTINMGTGAESFVNVGNITGTTQTTVKGGTGSSALALQVGSGGTIGIGANNNAIVNIGSGSTTAGNILIQGGVGSLFSATNTSGSSVLKFAAPSTSGIVTFQLPAGGVGTTTYDICTTLTVCTGYAGSASANTALSNLAAVAINLSLLPGVTNNIDVGSAAKTFANGYFTGIVSSPTVSSGDTTTASSPSAAFALRSGNTTGSSSSTGAVTLGSGNATTGSSGAVTIDSGTAGGGGTKGAVSIGAANTTSLILGNTGATTTTQLLGGTSVSIQTAASGSISLGTTNAGSISIGNGSNNGNSISLGNSTNGETINIENGATTAATTVAILSGVGTAGTASLSLGNNTRVTTIDLGNSAPAAARAITIGAGSGKAPAFTDTVNIATGATTIAGGETVHIADGTPTGSGTNLVTIGSLVAGSTTIIQGGTTGSGIQLTQGTGGNITIGSANTASTVTVQCGAGTSGNCGFATNGNDHSTYVGSGTGVSLTTITGGTGGITLTGAVTTSSTINTDTLSASALTFSGAAPVITSSTAGTGITLQSNGAGAVAVDSGAALGTVNLGVTNAKFVNLGNTTTTTQTVINGGTGINAIGIQAGSGGTISLGTSAAALVNIGSTTAATVTNIYGGTAATTPTGALNLQVGNGGAINIGTTSQTSIQNIGNTSISATTLINGGTGGTAIQLLQGNNGTITIGATGGTSAVQVQCGASATACSFGSNATDHSTTIGTTSSTTGTTINGGSGTISLTSNTSVSANKNLSLVSGTGQFSQAYTGTGDALTVTAAAAGSGPTALRITSTNANTTNTSYVGNQFNTTNTQATTANTGFIFGSDFEFTQNSSVTSGAVTSAAVNIALAANSSAPTDNNVTAILNVANNDTATGNLIQAGDGIRINAATASNISNGIDLVGTFGTNLIKSTPYTVTAAGAVSQAGNQTFTASGTVSIQSNASTLFNIQGNGTGTVAVDTSGAGTASLGATNAATVSVGSGNTTNLAINCATSAATCNFGSNTTDHTTNLGSSSGASLTAIQGGTSGITLTSGNTVASVLTAGFKIKTTSNSATALSVQNSSSFNVVTVDTTTPSLKVFNGLNGANYLSLDYNDSTTTGTIKASSGTTAVGSGTGAISVLAGAGSAITMTANATSLWRTTAGTLTIQSGTASDLILTSGSSIVQVSGSSVVKLGASAGDPGTCTAGAIVYNTSTNTLRGCQGGTLTWFDLVNVTTPTIQATYSAATGGTSTPEIILDNTRTALDIQGVNGNTSMGLFNVRLGAASGQGAAILAVTAAGVVQLNDNTGAAVLTADGGNGVVTVGSSAAHATNPTTLSLDSYQPVTGAALPTEIDGAMFYDSDANIFRCGINGFWQNCAINNIESSYVFEDEFLAGTSSAATGTNFFGVGALGWNMTATTSCAAAYNQTGPTLTHDHPGTLRMTTPATNTNGCALTQGGTGSAPATPTLSEILAAGDTYKTNVAISAQTGVMRMGWTNQTNNTTPSNGAYWEYVAATDATHLRYCYANGGTPVCATGPVFAATTWAELEIHVNATNSITFTANIGGVTSTFSTASTFGVTGLGPTTTCYSTGSILSCFVDYIQWSGYNTSTDGIRD